MDDNLDCVQSVQRRLSSIAASPDAIKATASSAFHPYACLICRSRKVKCDKLLSGCNNCRKAGNQCIYSARRTHKHLKTQSKLSIRPLAPSEGASDRERSSYGAEHLPVATLHYDENYNDNDCEDLVIPREMRDSSFQATFSSKQLDQGRLFVSDGKSRYIDSRKARQMANFVKLFSTDSSSEGEDDNRRQASARQQIPTPGKSIEKLAGSNLFSMAGPKRSIRNDHPPSQIIITLWDYYVKNVDVVVKILYRPAVEAVVFDASNSLKGIDPSTEALLFAIYFATVTSMTSEDCLRLCGETKSTLLQRYLSALEQALVQAEWMVTQETVILQAIILLLYCAPGKHSRFTWMLSGIAVGIAQAMGMHRDCATFSISNIDLEVRRRVWWTLCVLDNRISDECGLENHIPMTLDTKLPLNINDSDLVNNGSEPLASRTEFTEMTVSLVKIENAKISLSLKTSQHGKYFKSVDDIQAVVQEELRTYEQTYLPYFDRSSNLHNLCYLGMRLTIVKLWKMWYDLFQPNDPLNEREMKERLILYNTEILELTHQLPDKSSQFGWFFLCKYTQWHAMVYLLLELCNANNTQGPAVEQAWAVIDTIFDSLNNADSENTMFGNIQIRQSTLWQPLQRLLKRARYIRKQAVLHDHLQAQEYSEAHGHDSGRDTKSVQSVQTPPCENNALLGDPFLGSTLDVDVEMNWEAWDTLVQSFQMDNLMQQDCIHYQASASNMGSGCF